MATSQWWLILLLLEQLAKAKASSQPEEPQPTQTAPVTMVIWYPPTLGFTAALGITPGARPKVPYVPFAGGGGQASLRITQANDFRITEAGDNRAVS